MKKVSWTAVVIITIVTLLVLQVVTSLLGGWGYGPFGWFGMAFMWLMPLGFLTLIVLGIAWVVKATGGGNNPVAPAPTCSSCGREIQADWKNCPYCGTALTK